MIIGQNEHPIERIVDNAFIKMRTLIDADTVIGTPVVTQDGVSIIPISKVSMGFLTGGGEYGDLTKSTYSNYPFAGGSGAGVCVSPIGFLVSDGKTVKLVNMDEKSSLDKLLNLIPDVVASLLESGNKKKK